MRINFVNFKPTVAQKDYLEHEFGALANDLELDATFVINIKRIEDAYLANATLLQHREVIQEEMQGRTLAIIAPALVVELRSKLAWQDKRLNKSNDAVVVNA